MKAGGGTNLLDDVAARVVRGADVGGIGVQAADQGVLLRARVDGFPGVRREVLRFPPLGHLEECDCGMPRPTC